MNEIHSATDAHVPEKHTRRFVSNLAVMPDRDNTLEAMTMIAHPVDVSRM